jgi:hypothetical protein
MEIPDSEIDRKQVTFVTAYYTLESTPYFQTHSEEWKPDPIFELARSGIQLCLYISKFSRQEPSGFSLPHRLLNTCIPSSSSQEYIANCASESAFEDLAKECPNFRLMPYRLYYKDLDVYKTLCKYDCDLPKNRNMEKDTLEYMVYMHSRYEIMENAISENPWNSTHFSWIDFNAPKLFSKKEESFQKLREIATFPFPNSANYFAGCWSKLEESAIPQLSESIHWRFCGAFFLADAESLTHFAELYRTKFPEFLQKTGVFTWEVNFWSWLETTTDWNPTWYRGDHNDNMLNIFSGVSADTYATPLGDSYILSKKEYAYPPIEPFLPGSASYVEHLGEHYLNTRFVNYWMYPNGYYRFHNPDMVIENRNFCSLLDPETLEPKNFSEFYEQAIYGVDGNPLELPKREKRTFSVGLEDIRLFSVNDKIRFIATNVEYSPVSKNRMVLGTYDLATSTYRDCQVLIPPDPNSWCEKNWIPVVFVKNSGCEEERFIYKWSPMEIGRVNPETNQLQIIQRHETKHWLFSKLRGSTTFVDAPAEILRLSKDLRSIDTKWDSKRGAAHLYELTPENFVRRSLGENEYVVGLAHFSEEHSPRHYYHLLILLEKNTLKPVAISRVFYFEKLTIEFCIGMTTRVVDGKGRYVFWISRFDRDPVCLEVDIDALPLERLV